MAHSHREQTEQQREAIPNWGPATVEVRAKGIWRRPCSVERSEQELQGLSVGLQSSTRWTGARPSKHYIYALPV